MFEIAGQIPGSAVVGFQRDTSPSEITRRAVIQPHSHHDARVLLDLGDITQLDAVREAGDLIAFAKAPG